MCTAASSWTVLRLYAAQSPNVATLYLLSSLGDLLKTPFEPSEPIPARWTIHSMSRASSARYSMTASLSACWPIRTTVRAWQNLEIVFFSHTHQCTADRVSQGPKQDGRTGLIRPAQPTGLIQESLHSIPPHRWDQLLLDKGCVDLCILLHRCIA